MTRVKTLLPISLLVTAGVCHAADFDACYVTRDSDREPRLCTYEPNTFGWTDDSDDAGFLDIKLSLRYQIVRLQHEADTDRSAIYAAFSTRFAQYLDTRESSPVVGKRFNPKIFYRSWTGRKRDYVDVGYNHESNGQAINTDKEFSDAVSAASADEGRANSAYDRISRGWDYLDFLWRGEIEPKTHAYFVHKRFLTHGFLQGKAEEHGSHFVESDPQGKPRRYVNGLAAMLKKGFRCLGDACKVFASYETGYSRIGRYNTVRLETSFKICKVPLMIWGQTGYGSDLAQYYKKVESIGIAAELGSF